MVEWKKLGEICEVLDSQRKPVSKGNRRGGVYPYYGANGIQDYVENYIFDGTFLLLGEDGSVINKDKSPILHWASGKIWVNNHAHILKEIDNYSLRFIYYALQCVDVSDIVRGVPPKINQANMRNIQIPIPSLSEQNRIVGILDTFTDSIENLKQQIAQRRKQYEFYRDCILKHFDSKETTWKKLSEIAEIFKGPYITKKNSNEGAVPVVMGGQKAAYYIDNYNSEGESIVISRSGINAGYVSFWNQPIFVSDGYRIDNKDLMVKKYLFYFLKSIEDKINLSKKGAGVPHVQSKFLLNILIPVPPLSEQSRIVSILDTFEASISNLEAQLAQRQKQYEYYRNRLLSFGNGDGES